MTGACLYLKTLNVICLPAVERKMEILQLFEYLVGVNTDFCISCLG